MWFVWKRVYLCTGGSAFCRFQKSPAKLWGINQVRSQRAYMSSVPDVCGDPACLVHVCFWFYYFLLLKRSKIAIQLFLNLFISLHVIFCTKWWRVVSIRSIPILVPNALRNATVALPFPMLIIQFPQTCCEVYASYCLPMPVPTSPWWPRLIPCAH